MRSCYKRGWSNKRKKGMSMEYSLCQVTPVWWVSSARWWTVPPVSPPSTLIAAPLLARVWREAKGILTILSDNLFRCWAVDFSVNHLLKHRACLGDVKVGCRGRGKRGAHTMTLLPATTVHTSHQRHSYQTRLLVFKRLHAHTGDRMLTDEKSKPPHTH